MGQITVKKGTSRPLLGQQFKAGLGWDPAEGQTEEIDLDLWVLRHSVAADGSNLTEAIYWGNEDWHRPDLGINSQDMPFVATPELDVIYTGDDRTGRESEANDQGNSKDAGQAKKDGYDETALIDLSKAPKNVFRYSIFGTYYEDPAIDPPTKSLGMATNVKVGVKQLGTDNELVVDGDNRTREDTDDHLSDDHMFDVTVLVATIELQEDGRWHLKAVGTGYTESMVKIAQKLGMVFKD